MHSEPKIFASLLYIFFPKKRESLGVQSHISGLKNKQPNENKPSTWVIHLSHCLTAVLGMAVATGYCRALSISALPITSRLGSCLSREMTLPSFPHPHPHPHLAGSYERFFFFSFKREMKLYAENSVDVA